MNIEDVLQATLARWQAEPFSYRLKRDCMMSVIDHVRDATGFDAAPDMREHPYSTTAEAVELLNSFGGGRQFLHDRLTAIGLEPTGNPKRGDPICAKFGPWEVGGIWLGDETGVFRLEGRGKNEVWVKPIGAWAL